MTRDSPLIRQERGDCSSAVDKTTTPRKMATLGGRDGKDDKKVTWVKIETGREVYYITPKLVERGVSAVHERTITRIRGYWGEGEGEGEVLHRGS